jgi:hypothetical protein
MPIYLAHKLDYTTTTMVNTKQTGKASVAEKVWNPPFCQDSKIVQVFGWTLPWWKDQDVRATDSDSFQVS